MEWDWRQIANGFLYISFQLLDIGYQILAEYVSFHMRYCLLVWNENGEGLDYVSQNGESVAINNKTCVFEIDNGGHANEQCS